MPTVEKSVSLKSYNTFAVDVSAQYFAEVCTPEDIRSVLADPRYGQLPDLCSEAARIRSLPRTSKVSCCT